MSNQAITVLLLENYEFSQDIKGALGPEHQLEKHDSLKHPIVSSVETSDFKGIREGTNDNGKRAYTLHPPQLTFHSAEAPAQPTSPLLTLPVELRLEIFKHLLILPPDAPPPWHNTYPARAQPLYPAILRVNQQLHAEALPLLYRGNTFLAHNALLATLPRLRREYGPVVCARLAGLITRFHVRVRLDAAPGFDREGAAEQFSGKQEVVVDAWQTMWRGSGPEVLRLFEGVRGVRRAKVVGSIGGFEGYAKWLERSMMREIGVSVEPFCWGGGREPESLW